MRRAVIRTAATGLALAGGVDGLLAQSPKPSAPPVTAPAANAVAATVNGEPIPLARVDAYIRAKVSDAPLTGSPLRRLRTDVVSDMIDDLLLEQFLARHGPKVDPAEIDQQIKAFTTSLNKRGKTFAGFLKETDQTEAAVRKTWTTLHQLNGYVKQHVSDEQLRQYYAANKDFFDRVEVKVSHVVVRVGATAPAVEKAAAKEKLAALRADIMAGKLDFAAAARKYSQCPSAPDGGDLGYLFRKGMLMDEAFCAAAFALKVGETSGVVETEYGLHLIRVTDSKPGTPSTFEACVEDVRDSFAQDFRGELVARLRKQAQIQVTVP